MKTDFSSTQISNEYNTALYKRMTLDAGRGSSLIALYFGPSMNPSFPAISQFP